jgi:hypothetical protein
MYQIPYQTMIAAQIAMKIQAPRPKYRFRVLAAGVAYESSGGSFMRGAEGE